MYHKYVGPILALVGILGLLGLFGTSIGAAAAGWNVLYGVLLFAGGTLTGKVSMKGRG